MDKETHISCQSVTQMCTGDWSLERADDLYGRATSIYNMPAGYCACTFEYNCNYDDFAMASTENSSKEIDIDIEITCPKCAMFYDMAKMIQEERLSKQVQQEIENERVASEAFKTSKAGKE